LSRIRRSAEDARDHILSAAERLLITKGPLALKLTEIASAADVANASVMHHFGSIESLRAALMDRMIGQLVADILSAPPVSANPESAIDAMLHALFDVFEARGAARLAAWLELSGEAHRLKTVQDAIKQVITKRLAGGGISSAAAHDLVLVNLALAMGAGLFGRSLAELAGKPPGRTRKLAIELMKAQAAWLMRS
jgi:AcrR family transcriptional regulator